MALTQQELLKIRQVNDTQSPEKYSLDNIFDSQAATLPPVEPTKNLGEVTSDEMAAGGQKIVDSVLMASDKYNNASGILGKTTALLEGALGTAAGGVQTIFAPISATIKNLSDKLANTKIAQDIGNNPAVSSTIDFVNSGIAHAQKIAESHPEAARNIVDGLNVALAALGDKIPLGDTPLTRAVGDVAGEVKSFAADTKDSLGEFLKSREEVKNLKDTLDVTKPTLNKKESIAAFENAGKPGGMDKSGTFSKYKQTPTARDLDIANSVKNVVLKNNDPISNIVNINQEIGRISESEIKPHLENNKALFNFEDYRKYTTDRVVPDNSLKSDPEAFSTYKRVTNRVINEVYSSLKSAAKKSGDYGSATDFNQLWNARKTVDSIIDKELGSATFDSPQYTGIRAAAKDSRDLLGKFISDSLKYPGQLEKLNKMQEFIIEARNRGIEIDEEGLARLKQQVGLKSTPESEAIARYFNDRMKKLNLMYEARGNIAEANYKLKDKNFIERWIKENPKKAKMGMYLLGGIPGYYGVKALSGN